MARDHTSYIPPPYIEAMGFTLPLNSKNGWSPSCGSGRGVQRRAGGVAAGGGGTIMMIVG